MERFRGLQAARRGSIATNSPRAFRLLEDLGTEPKVYYLAEGEWYAKAR